ncbi:MAG: transketolase family protein [Veillonellaceae bacterium]|nr:transketolase family protein [Veillonellaceae bacterium]
MGKATRDAYGEVLQELGAEYPEMYVLDADLSKSTKTYEFKKLFPERHFNVGIAEQNMISVAAGLATTGKIPFASTFAIFAAGRAYEQIRNSVCYPQLNVKVAVTHAGLTVGEDGATHQMVEDIALMRALPNMTVTVPADAAETKAVVRWAAAYRGPVYIRMGRSGVPDVMPEDTVFEPGKATVLRDGKDLTLIACGIMVAAALAAADKLAADGISARVLNMSSIKPIDRAAIIAAARETGAIVTAEEHTIYGGLGGATAEVVAAEAPVPMAFVGVKDTFGESGTPADLLAKYGLTADDIVAAAQQVLRRK